MPVLYPLTISAPCTPTTRASVHRITPIEKTRKKERKKEVPTNCTETGHLHWKPLMLVCSPTTSVRLFLPGPTPLPFSAVPANSVCSNRRPGPAPSNTFEGNGASGSLFGHAIYKIITFSLGLRDLAWPWLGKCGVCARVTRLRDGHMIPGWQKCLTRITCCSFMIN